MESGVGLAHRRHDLRGLALASHPIPSAAVTVIALLLAIGIGLTPARMVLFTVAVLAGQLSIGWSNDRIDAARDAANARSDKPAATGDIALSVLTVATLLAVVASTVLFFLLGWRVGVVALLMNGAGWAYNLGLKATVLSGLTYLVGPGLLPVVAYLAAPASPPWWAPVAGGLLGLGAHIANVLPDLRADEATGVRGLPHRLGIRVATVVMAIVLAAASVVVVFGPGSPAAPVVAAAVVAVLLACASAVLGVRRPDSPLAFYVALGVALIDVVLFGVVI
ncbi:MAG TPA: UbiA family prenyltransferase [Pseudonocardiaceae bacterium]